ncbi:MAG: hypothetical protein AAF251_12580 [Pseudomonadota bacterium]
MKRLFAAAALIFGFAFSSIAPAAAQELKNSGKGSVGDEVGIASFTVAFFHVKKDKMRTFDGGRKSMEVALSGLTADQLQKVTEVAYESFVSDLETAGVAVRDRAGLAAALEEGGKLKPFDQGHEVKMYFGRNKADGKVLLFTPTAFGGPVPNRDHEGLALMFRGFQMMKVMPGALHFEAVTKKYAKENGVAVINPLIVIDFADFDTYDGKYVKAVEAQSSLAVTGKESGVNQTSVQFYGANGKMGRIVMQDSLAVAGGFGRIEKGGGVPLGQLMGLSTKSKYAFAANKSQWVSGMAELLTAVSPALAKAMATR